MITSLNAGDESQGEAVATRRSPAWTTACKWILALFFFGYVLIRVFTLDLVNDEATSGRPIIGLITFDWVDAQIHFLADILITLCVRYLPFDDVTAVRVPSILAAILYLYATAKITVLIKPRWMQCLSYAAFASNAFMLDFFSLGRGYSLSLAFAMLSLRFLLDESYLTKSAKSKTMAFLCIWSASLAVLSNLAFLHFYMALGTVLVSMSIDFRTVKDVRSPGALARFVGQIIKVNGYILANAAIVAVFYLPRVIQLVQQKKLYSGGTEGFIVDTVQSLVAETFYDIRISESLTLTVTIAVVAVWALITLRLVYPLLRGATADRDAAWRAALFFSSLIAISALISVMLHLVADIRFLMSRTALIFFPLFIGQVVFFAASEMKAYIRIPAVALTCLVIGIFALNANLTHTDTWKMNCKSRQLFRDLTLIHQELGRDVVLGVSDAHKPKLNDYMRLMDITWLKWYSIDMYHRFNGQYQIHPKTDYFYLWHKNGDFPPGLEALPIDKYGADYSLAESVLYKVRDGAKLSDYLNPVKQP